MKQTIRLNEDDLRNIIKEAISEISPQTLYHARDNAETLYDDTVESAIRDIEECLDSYREEVHSPWWGSGKRRKINYGEADKNRLFNDACKGIEAVKRFFDRKREQYEKFNSDYEDFVNSKTQEELDDFIETV
jgi:predicted RNA methylase